MLKVYVLLDDKAEYIIGYSTNESGVGQEVIQDDPIIDISKLSGYKLEFNENDGYNHLVFDNEKYNKIINEQLERKSLQEAHDVLDKIMKDNILNSVDDEAAYAMRLLYPQWEIGVNYKKDERFMYLDMFYKVLQDHISQEEWLPMEAPSLYVEISNPNEEYPLWKQPTSSANAYMINDKVTFEGVKYVSLIDNNTWSPVDYPQGWQVVA